MCVYSCGSCDDKAVSYGWSHHFVRAEHCIVLRLLRVMTCSELLVLGYPSDPGQQLVISGPRDVERNVIGVPHNTGD